MRGMNGCSKLLQTLVEEKYTKETWISSSKNETAVSRLEKHNKSSRSDDFAIPHNSHFNHVVLWL